MTAKGSLPERPETLAVNHHDRRAGIAEEIIRRRMVSARLTLEAGGSRGITRAATGAMTVTRSKRVELNEMEFQKYGKYGADSSIRFDEPRPKR
jgi:hypothetical protein